MTLVLCDSNEAATNPTVVHELIDLFGEENVVTTHLQFGDVNIPLETGLLAIERKAPDDLLASIADGRLFEQANAMTNGATFPAFVVHGTIHFNKEGFAVTHGRHVTGWKARSVRAALLSVQWAGCAVAQVEEDAYAQTVLELVGLASHPEHVQRGREHPITFPPIDPRVDFLCGVTGVGPVRAEALLRYAHSSLGKSDEDELGTIANALTIGTLMHTFKAIARAEGWGPKTTQQFREFLGLKDNEYLSLAHIQEEAR